MEYENNDTSDEEDLIAPPEFVQIIAPYKEVNCWITSFIQEKREQINLHNIQDFCVPSELRQNCARVDAVLVKRKGTTSHITVKDIKNYCGPQEQIDKQVVTTQSDKILSKKKIFTSDDIEEKIKKLQAQISYGSHSPTSNTNVFQEYSS